MEYDAIQGRLKMYVKRNVWIGDVDSREDGGVKASDLPNRMGIVESTR